VARHASATKATVDVAVDGDSGALALVVVDDGVGITAPPTRNGGIANMAARAARWHGRCTIRPADEGGTRVEWVVELPE
jgi:signal transduction histidine kinase